MTKAQQYIEDFKRGYSNEITDGEYEFWLTPWQAETACHLEREETIEKACEYMRNHIDEQLTIYHKQTWKKCDEFIKDFKQAMMEE